MTSWDSHQVAPQAEPNCNYSCVAVLVYDTRNHRLVIVRVTCNALKFLIYHSINLNSTSTHRMWTLWAPWPARNRWLRCDSKPQSCSRGFEHSERKFECKRFQMSCPRPGKPQPWYLQCDCQSAADTSRTSECFRPSKRCKRVRRVAKGISLAQSMTEVSFGNVRWTPTVSSECS